MTDDQGNVYTFEKLLLATGATPRRLPFDDGSIIYYRTVEDYRHLRALTEQGRRFAVIGGGFIGWEMAAALAMNGKEVVMLFPGEAIGDHVYPIELARFLNDFYRAEGSECSSSKHGHRLGENGPGHPGENPSSRRIPGGRGRGRNWRYTQRGVGSIRGPES